MSEATTPRLVPQILETNAANMCLAVALPVPAGIRMTTACPREPARKACDARPRGAAKGARELGPRLGVLEVSLSIGLHRIRHLTPSPGRQAVNPQNCAAPIAAGAEESAWNIATPQF